MVEAVKFKTEFAVERIRREFKIERTALLLLFFGKAVKTFANQRIYNIFKMIVHLFLLFANVQNTVYT